MITFSNLPLDQKIFTIFVADQGHTGAVPRATLGLFREKFVVSHPIKVSYNCFTYIARNNKVGRGIFQMPSFTPEERLEAETAFASKISKRTGISKLKLKTVSEASPEDLDNFKHILQEHELEVI